MIQRHTNRLLSGRDNQICRNLIYFLPWHFIIQPISYGNVSFKEKAKLLFQSVKSQYFIFRILAFFCVEIIDYNLNTNEKRSHFNYGLFKR